METNWTRIVGSSAQPLAARQPSAGIESTTSSSSATRFERSTEAWDQRAELLDALRAQDRHAKAETEVQKLTRTMLERAIESEIGRIRIYRFDGTIIQLTGSIALQIAPPFRDARPDKRMHAMATDTGRSGSTSSDGGAAGGASAPAGDSAAPAA